MAYIVVYKKFLFALTVSIVLMVVSSPAVLDGHSLHIDDVRLPFTHAHTGESPHTHYDISAIENAITLTSSTESSLFLVDDLPKRDPPQNYYSTIEYPPESLSLS